MECLEEKSIRIRTKRSTTVVGTGRCARCGGFMVDDRSIDFEGNDCLRCVQCGEHLDPVILENRRR